MLMIVVISSKDEVYSIEEKAPNEQCHNKVTDEHFFVGL